MVKRRLARFYGPVYVILRRPFTFRL